MAGKSEGVSIKVPYRNLRKEAEAEMVDESHHRIDLNSSPDSPPTVPGWSPDSSSPIYVRSKQQCSLTTLILISTVAAGSQFGSALQLSLLTPYIQTLGIEHAFSSFIWLCGPITGLVVQPSVGIWSDKCTSKFGRRRPFILAGALMISPSKFGRSIAVHLKGPAHALLADLSSPEQRNSANAVYCSWLAVGNILGFAAACCEACANLKAAFLLAVVFLTLCTLVTIYFAKEIPLSACEQPNHLSDSAPLLDDLTQTGLELSKLEHDIPVVASANMSSSENGYEQDKTPKHLYSKAVNDQNENFSDRPGAVLVNLLTSLRQLSPAMHSVLIVSALSWFSWFPFFLFDTDWMGREVYHGDPKGDFSEMKLYDQGVRQGAFGLLLNSVVLGIGSFFIERMCQWMGARLVWAMSNFTLFACMAITAIISLISVREYSEGIQHVIGENEAIKIAALIVFALLGFPLAITSGVPYSIIAELTANSGGGQGLAIGILNISIVIPQMIISLGAGPWDALFGGGNIPAFILAAFCALAAGIIATLKLPDLSSSSFKSSGFPHVESLDTEH
ncbi:hypothetical protein SLA2020_112940 [Shorea laevis]